jgi:hypothetical protein
VGIRIKARACNIYSVQATLQICGCGRIRRVRLFSTPFQQHLVRVEVRLTYGIIDAGAVDLSTLDVETSMVAWVLKI